MAKVEKIDFTGIGESALRTNIERVWYDVAGLMTLLPHAKKSENKRLENCLRKTIIIYTASILEALLRWHIINHLGSGKIILKDEWKRKTLYTLPPQSKDNTHRIVLAKETMEQKDSSNLDFNRMIRICETEELLNSDTLNDVDKVRKMRNELHIDGLTDAIKTYSQKDVDFVLSKAKELARAI